MSTKLADTRAVSITDADNLLEAIAHAKIRIVRMEVHQEAAIARAKSRCAATTMEDRMLIAELEKQLTSFILGNRGTFKRPRQRKTPFGKFGLVACTKVDLTDRAAVIQHALDNGYDDCIQTTHSPDKAGILARIDAGETVPGAEKRSGDVAKYSIDRTLLKEAAEDVA